MSAKCKACAVLQYSGLLSFRENVIDRKRVRLSYGRGLYAGRRDTCALGSRIPGICFPFILWFLRRLSERGYGNFALPLCHMDLSGGGWWDYAGRAGGFWSKT